MAERCRAVLESEEQVEDRRRTGEELRPRSPTNGLEEIRLAHALGQGHDRLGAGTAGQRGVATGTCLTGDLITATESTDPDLEETALGIEDVRVGS